MLGAPPPIKPIVTMSGDFPCHSVYLPTQLAQTTVCLLRLALKTIALRLGLDEKELDKSCDEVLLPCLANFVHPWREVFAYLLAPIDLDDIDSENAGRSEQTKRLASLRKWKVKCGAKATYGVLITSLLKNGDVQNAENICQHLENSWEHEGKPSSIDTTGRCNDDNQPLIH